MEIAIKHDNITNYAALILYELDYSVCPKYRIVLENVVSAHVIELAEFVYSDLAQTEYNRLLALLTTDNREPLN